MTLFNIGPLEFILVLVIMFILLGPEGMIKTARQIGTWIRKTVRSPLWGEVLGYSREIRELPTKIVRESGLDEDLKEIQKAATDATREAQNSIQQANVEINQSLKDAGSIEVKIDGTGAKTKASAVNPLQVGASSTSSPSSYAQTGTTTTPQGESATSVTEEPKPPIVID